jgi:adenylate kinase
MRVLILGPQGSGKGTQAARIAETYGVLHVATGDILRSSVADGTELGRRVEPILDRGDLVPDDLMIGLIRECLERADGFVLDGFPRTLPQVEALDVMLDEIEKPLDVVLLLEVPDDVAVERLLERGAVEHRADDEPEAIRNRLRLYHQLTEPVVEHYRSNGTLVTVAGDQSVEHVWASIEDALTKVRA